MKQRFIFIHGNGTTHWSFGFAPWLKAQLEKAGHKTFFETMPDSIIARSEYWLPFLENHVKAKEDDILIGMSSGAVAAMRYAENHKIKGSILISPCYTDLADEMEKQSGYYDAPWNWQAIKDNQQHIALFWGDNDPFIPQAEFDYIAEQLQPSTFKIPKAGHFIDRTAIPEVIHYIKQTYS